MGIYKFELKEFILNLLGLNTTYNHPAWFLRLYVMLLLIYPIIIKIVNSYNRHIITTISFIINMIGMLITKIYYMSGINSIIIDLIAAKYAIFNKT